MPILRSPRYRLIRLSWKKSLIPKVSEKWYAVARETPYEGDLRRLLLRQSESSRQHGRATRWLADHPVLIDANLMGIGFCALGGVLISKYIQSIASIEDSVRHYECAELIALSSARHENEKPPPPQWEVFLYEPFACCGSSYSSIKCEVKRLRKSFSAVFEASAWTLSPRRSLYA